MLHDLAGSWLREGSTLTEREGYGVDAATIVLDATLLRPRS